MISVRRAVSFATLVFVSATGCAPADSGAPNDTADTVTAESRAVPTPDFTLDASSTHARFSSAIPAVLRVPDGSVVEAFTKEASDGQITEATGPGDLASVDFDPIHPLTGPVYVEGAEVGDVLAVTLHEVEVTGWGWSVILPGFGFLADEFDQPFTMGFDIGPDSDFATFGNHPNIRVPLRPFPGVMGVAPATDSMLTTIPPRANGGNMDNRNLIPGTTVYFPVFVEGAHFSVGDAHAAQGNGEVSGTAIEAPVRIVYEVNVIKGGHAMSEPQYETDDYYAVTAFATTIDEAARKATRFMIDYLEDVHGLTRQEAYVLCSLAGDLQISEVVDVPHMLVSMHMPKSVLGID